MLNRIIKDKTGKIPLMMFGFLFALFAFSMLIMEVGGMMERHDYVVSVIQRSCNSALEKNIPDKYRQDNIIIFDTVQADSDLREYIDQFNEGNDNKYNVVISEIVAISDTEEDIAANGIATKLPQLLVKGTMTIPMIFGSMSFDVEYNVWATNYKIDNYQLPQTVEGS